MPYLEPIDPVIVQAEPLRRWTADLLERIGTPPEIAADVAEVLVAADLRGIASHGTARLPSYVALVEAGVLEPAARPARVGGRGAIALFDAGNGWGHHAGRVAMDDCIDRATETGVAVSVVRNTNHYGIAGWYAMRALAKRMIGVSLTNASPLIAPTRARVPMIGTNPIAVAVPAGRHGGIVLDMATSTVSRGQVEVAGRRGDTLRADWAIAPDGSPARTVEEALAGALQPLGGDEQGRGYKGYGLALVVDLLSGLLPGASYGPHILGLFSTEGPSELGHFFMAIDPAAVGDAAEFEGRAEEYVERLAAAPLIPGAPGPVLYPGQLEAERAERNARSGIPIDREHHAGLVALGERLGVPFGT